MIATNYLPKVAWVTVIQDAVVIDAVTYRVTVVPSDPSEPGANRKEVGYVLVDFVGNTYVISAINVDGIDTNIAVTDDFSCGWCPQIGRPAIICQTVGDGNAPYLSPIHYEYLDKSALGKRYAIDLAILWGNKGDTDRISAQSAYNIDVLFKGFYKVPPVGKENTKVYREDSNGGKTVLSEVLFHSQNVTVDGFTLTIDESENLDGVWIYYNFNAAT